MDGLKVLIEPTIRILQEAGRLLISFRASSLSRTRKPDQGFVTEADLAVESFLVNKLSELTPGYHFYAEENGEIAEGESDYCWVIDPLDGTNNFAQGLPHFCISVALTHRHEPVLGFVYQPLLNEMFHAIKHGGAYLNDKPIHVSSHREIEGSVLVSCIPYIRSAQTIRKVHEITDLALHYCVLRILGAAALDQAYVACGKIDGIFLGALGWWDVAAGLLLIQEAGGIVTEIDGRKLVTKAFRSFIGGNAYIHRALAQTLQDDEDSEN
ncbi:inositol monophosphatase [Candidatus Babeliales bacterium]|nr:inositol monophosphatase [Candidatus Babeliales bacterium]